MNISIVQSEIALEDKVKNLTDYYRLLLQLKGKTDLVVLPETFTTGFSSTVLHLAETNTGNTIRTIQTWTNEFGFALAGSFLAQEMDGKRFNRGFFITPEGKTFFSDKRHLFRMSEESKLLTAGKDCPIISYKGWYIRLIICYDLRFPVWVRNQANRYDLLLCVANWPKVRAKVWDILLKARAIENQCYVCGVNRTGIDKNNIVYHGHSVIVDYKGEIITTARENRELILTVPIYKENLKEFRNKFPVWQDADLFNIVETHDTLL